LLEQARSTKFDINEHRNKLRELAAQADSVVEFGMRHGVSTVATRQLRLERYGASRPVTPRNSTPHHRKAPLSPLSAEVIGRELSRNDTHYSSPESSRPAAEIVTMPAS
jgi:hypothetical protein